MTNLAPNSEVMSPGGLLSEREIAVVQLLVRGYCHKDIARALDISVRTVAAHRSHLSLKTGCSNSLQLGVWLVRNGVVPMVSA